VPLVSKLKENDKTVIGVGMKNSTSDLLASNCDEFIFYDDLAKQTSRAPRRVAKLPKKQQECFELVLDAIDALERENKEVIWGSMVKQTIKRKKPSFNESTYGYSRFNELLEDAAKAGLIGLTRALAREFGPRGIRVNQVTPGGTRTPIWDRLAPTDDAKTALEARLSRSVPLGRMGEADEVARAVLYLASDDASNVTGTEIVVDGGTTGAPHGAPIFRAA